MTRWEQILRRSVLDVGAYSPGVSGAEIQARFDLPQVIRLNWNENLFGPLPGVIDDAASELNEAWAYPEQSYDLFRDAVARWTGVDPAQVIPGHGIQALTLALTSAFLEPGEAVVIPTPTYGLYAQAARAAGANVHRIDCLPSLALDLDGLAAAARQHDAKLVWICDPNNPTGLRLAAADWQAFVTALPGGCVAVVDEAYVDYVETTQRVDRVAQIAAGEPVIVLRTFSKIFGLAGLRLGYALVHESLAPFLHSVQEPFNVNRAALAAGLASLRRTETLLGRREQVRAAREALTVALGAGGVRCLPSDGNFALVELGCDDIEVCDALAREGLLLRPGSELGLPGYVRVTTASVELMQRVGDSIVRSVGALRRHPRPPNASKSAELRRSSSRA